MARNVSAEIVSTRMQENLTAKLFSPLVLADKQIRDNVYEPEGPEIKMLNQAAVLNEELLFCNDLTDPVQFEIFQRVQ